MDNLWPNRRWLIIPTTVTSSIDWSQVLESEPTTLRLSVDQQKTFVKYDVTVVTASYSQSWYDPTTHTTESILIPSGTYGRPDIYPEGLGEYQYNEILVILSTPEWTRPITGSVIS
jgi:hypothetical protein